MECLRGGRLISSRFLFTHKYLLSAIGNSRLSQPLSLMNFQSNGRGRQVLIPALRILFNNWLFTYQSPLQENHEVKGSCLSLSCFQSLAKDLAHRHSRNELNEY